MSKGMCAYLLVLTVALSGCWLERANARTLSRGVFSPSQFIALLLDNTIDQVVVEAPLLALTEDVFQGVRTPIRLNRTVSVVGSPALPEPPMMLLFARHKIELCPGISFVFVNMAIQFCVTDSPARAPNFYIFSPSLAPSVGSNTTRIVFQDSLVIFGVGLPLELRKANVLAVTRPPYEGSGPQDIDFMAPYPHGTCTYESAAPLRDRCWSTGGDVYRDAAFAGADVSTADGTLVPNNVSVRILSSILVCRQNVSEECIASLGPYGCLVFSYRQLRDLPPVPISAQMAAILAQQQQQQQPSVPPGFHTPSPGPAGLLDNGSSDAGGGSTAVLVGAIVGGVLGAAALVGAVGAILWYVRRRSSGAAQSSLPLDASTIQPKCAVGLDSSSVRSASLQEQAAAQQDGKASRLADYSEHATLMSLTDRDGHGSVETVAATSGNRQDPAGIQAHGSENSSRMLPDLVVHASPFREGLSTNLVVLVPLRGTPTTAGGGVSLPRTPAAAAPASVSSASRPSSGARSFGGSSAAQNGAGGSAPPGIQKEAGGAAAAGQRQVRPLSAAAACGAGGSDRGTIFVSAGNEPEITWAAAYASKVAAMLLHTSSDVDSLLHIAYGSGLRPLAAGTAVAAGAAGMEAAAGAAQGAAAVPVDAEAMSGVRAVGTPAAAVSLLPLPEACEEQNVQVEVVELLPIKLGRGSFGRVQEGRYRGQRVAVKQALDLHDGLSVPTGKLVASFLQEVEVMGRCDHPNICKLLAACLAPPKLCLVMEMMDTSLESLIKGQTPGQLLPLPKLLHIAIQVAQGLEERSIYKAKAPLLPPVLIDAALNHAHALATQYLHPTVLHRDLKPANVLISNPESGTPIVKLTDFGLSKITEMTLQTANTEAGTPAYMAPECFDVTNDKLTHKVDMYAFGVLLWAMLTGEEPWKGYPLVSVAYSVHCGRRLPLDDIPDSRCPRKMRKLVEQCWEPTPRRRPAAAEAVKELLLLREQLLTEGAAPSSTEIS